jgi:hypothetical protein
MKTFILFLFPLLSFSQSNYIQLSEFSVVTKDRDTLFLLNDDIGNKIKNSWNTYSSEVQENSPVIIMVAALPLATRKKSLENSQSGKNN